MHMYAHALQVPKTIKFHRASIISPSLDLSTHHRHVELQKSAYAEVGMGTFLPRLTLEILSHKDSEILR